MRRRGLTLLQVGALALSLSAVDLLAVIGPSLLSTAGVPTFRRHAELLRAQRAADQP
ncbi:MAG: hypothetical protein KIS84_00135 [Dokdonella sp.]|nr:hypothetical protein [Dokdonella sp.]